MAIQNTLFLQENATQTTAWLNTETCISKASFQIRYDKAEAYLSEFQDIMASVKDAV